MDKFIASFFNVFINVFFILMDIGAGLLRALYVLSFLLTDSSVFSNVLSILFSISLLLLLALLPFLFLDVTFDACTSESSSIIYGLSVIRRGIAVIDMTIIPINIFSNYNPLLLLYSST